MENSLEYFIGYEEEGNDDFPDKRGGKYNGVYFFRGDSDEIIYTSTDGDAWRKFKQEWQEQQQEYQKPEEEQEEIVEENFEDTTIYNASDAGTPLENNNIPADTDDGNDLDKLDFSSRYANPNGSGNDNISGTKGTNTFDFNPLLNAKPEIIAKHVDGDGRIDWRGVAGENDNYHDHWVDSLGEDTIADFSGSGGEGDKINIVGHTVAVKVLEESDSQVKLGIYSDQGADGARGDGAHDFDVLGTITVNHDGNFNYGSDVTVNPNVFDGTYEFA